MKDQMINWYLFCIKEIASICNTGVQFDDQTFSWLRLERFTLPKFYNFSHTKLLIELPGLLQFDNPKKFTFFITNNLKRTDGSRIQNYFNKHAYNKYYWLGYGSLSLHIQSFNPSLDIYSGDRLIDIVQVVYNFLARR